WMNENDYIHKDNNIICKPEIGVIFSLGNRSARMNTFVSDVKAHATVAMISCDEELDEFVETFHKSTDADSHGIGGTEEAMLNIHGIVLSKETLNLLNDIHEHGHDSNYGNNKFILLKKTLHKVDMIYQKQLFDVVMPQKTFINTKKVQIYHNYYKTVNNSDKSSSLKSSKCSGCPNLDHVDLDAIVPKG
ncbi:unnamed protein product, partial [Meganyctiphanes norvegica]